MQTANEALIVALARTGDSNAFAELVRRKQGWLRNFMYRTCGDSSLADDLAQQTFLQAWNSIRKLRDARRFNGWLRTVAVNVWLKHHRSAPVAETHLSITEDGPVLPASSHPQPDLAIDLDRALTTLSTSVRLCVVLSYHEGLSHREITVLTGLPLGTVKSHIKRGSDQLKALLNAYQHDPQIMEQNDE